MVTLEPLRLAPTPFGGAIEELVSNGGYTTGTVLRSTLAVAPEAVTQQWNSASQGWTQSQVEA